MKLKITHLILFMITAVRVFSQQKQIQYLSGTGSDGSRGVVDIKRTEIEKPDDIARAIERGEKTLGKGRVKYIHPDCGFWMLPRNVADGKIRALPAGRDLYEGRKSY